MHGERPAPPARCRTQHEPGTANMACSHRSHLQLQLQCVHASLTEAMLASHLQLLLLTRTSTTGIFILYYKWCDIHPYIRCP